MKNTKCDVRISLNILVTTINAHGLNSHIRDTIKTYRKIKYINRFLKVCDIQAVAKRKVAYQYKKCII